MPAPHRLAQPVRWQVPERTGAFAISVGPAEPDVLQGLVAQRREGRRSRETAEATASRRKNLANPLPARSVASRAVESRTLTKALIIISTTLILIQA